MSDRATRWAETIGVVLWLTAAFGGAALAGVGLAEGNSRLIVVGSASWVFSVSVLVYAIIYKGF